MQKIIFFIYIKEAHALIVPKRNFACLDDIEILSEFVEDEGMDIHIKKRYGEEEIDESKDI